MELEEEEEYFDILIIGRIGWGKKTLLDKLVGADEGALKRDWLKEICDIADDTGKQTFRIVSNKKSPPIRVTVVPGLSGFTDINTDAANSVRDRNTGLIRMLFLIQRKLKMSFKRVVYFLPVRGPPEKADSYLRDELQTLWNFYEERIFQSMVMIATNSPDEDYQAVGFSESFKMKAMAVVTHVLSEVSGAQITCPPIAYLPLTCTSDEALGIVQNCDAKPFSGAY